MTPNSIKSGWWVSTDDRFVACYDTKEEALAHIEYQRKYMDSTINWYIDYFEIIGKEHIRCPYES